MADRPAAGLLRNVSTRRIVRALERDGFEFTERQGSQRIYRHPDGRRIVVHYHRANATLPPYVLRNLLAGTGWSEADLRPAQAREIDSGAPSRRQAARA